ncbi:transcriptional regulator, TetR family [Treponema bryantii]|uniref:Transcriptional regulator, TetR family n=1 Tax=Treponema bryantii TaxID=163 RepID=A0A1H9DE92_9SPIR|nr:TetR/AcrR family transcriptional regulator [Treponema bryantii]BDC92061.1 TetR family transcriptional regulator [Treponema bryantii]SEQ11617.1 transcriptional regulator, TetR family [Treponema bryantii]
MSDKYHHGDLRNALIEEGIKMINTSGEDSLSMRKLAEKCGVSMAAPYAHFKNKEEMITAIKQYVEEAFTEYLEAAVNKAEADVEARIVALGIAYVSFFIDNPEYFTFLFSRGYVHLNLDFHSSDENIFKPYKLLKDLCTRYFDEKKPGLSDYEKELDIIRIWSSVQGVTSIIFMKNVKWSHDWKEEIKNIII